MKKYQETQPQISFKRDGRFRGGLFGDFLPDPAPDLLTATADFDYLQAVRSEQLADLSELWDEAQLTDKIPQNVRSLIELDGKPFMTPLAVNWSAIYYNKAVFAQAGLQPPTTWDEFVEVCEQLIPALRDRAGLHLFLAETGNRIVGLALCFDGFSTFRARPLLNIHDLTVHPHFQCQGIGDKLLSTVIDFARQKSYCAVTLEVMANNPAKRLYARHGFEPLDGTCDGHGESVYAHGMSERPNRAAEHQLKGGS